MRTILLSALIFLPSFAFGQSIDFKDFDFSRIDSIALKNRDIKLRDPIEIAKILTKGLETEPEKFRVIFRWITATISYDVDLLWKKTFKEAKLKYNKTELEEYKERLIQKQYGRILKKRTAICFGYSYLLEAMCRSVGIECTTVNGYSQTRVGKASLDHAWNAVKLNNKWYLTDPTWASGYVNPGISAFIRKFNKYYFLADPEYFIANHYPKDKSWLLLVDKPSLEDFYNSPIRTAGFYSNQLVNLTHKRGQIKAKVNESLSIGFTANKEITSIAIEESKRNYFYSSRIYNFKKDDQGFYRFDHTFTTKGVLQFLIFVNGHHTLTYEVSVN